MKPLVENRYAKVRRLLDDLDFKEAFGIESLPLVERLVNEVRQAKSSLKLRDKEFSYFKNVAEELEEGVLPFRNENQRLAKENSLLRLAVLRTQEDAHDKVHESKSRLRDLETENGDLKLLIKEFVSRIEKFNSDILEKTRKIAELQARNLEAVICVKDGVKKMGGQKQRMEIDQCIPVPTVTPQAVSIRNFAKFGKECDKRATTDYLRIADSRIEALHLQNRELKLAQKDLLELVGCMNGKVESREQEIEKLKFYFERNGPIPKNGNFGDDAEQTIKMLELQLEMLQRRNIGLEGKLKTSLLDEHDKFMRGVEATAGEREYLAAILGLDGEEISLEDMLRYQEKIQILESRLAQCCKEKALLKNILNSAGLDCNDPQTTSKTKGGLRKSSSQFKQDRPVRDTDEFSGKKRDSTDKGAKRTGSKEQRLNSMEQILKDGFQLDMLNDNPEKIERRSNIGNSTRNSQSDQTRKGSSGQSGGEMNYPKDGLINRSKSSLINKTSGIPHKPLPNSRSKDNVVYRGKSTHLNEYSTGTIHIKSADSVHLHKNHDHDGDDSVDLQRVKSSGIFLKEHEGSHADVFGHESPIKRGSVEERSRYKPSLESEEGHGHIGKRLSERNEPGGVNNDNRKSSSFGESGNRKGVSPYSGKNTKLDYPLNGSWTGGNSDRSREPNEKGKNAQPTSTPKNSINSARNRSFDGEEMSDFEEMKTLDRIHDPIDNFRADDSRFSQDDDESLDESHGENRSKYENESLRGSESTKGKRSSRPHGDEEHHIHDHDPLYSKRGNPNSSHGKDDEKNSKENRRKSTNRRNPNEMEGEEEQEVAHSSQRENSQNRRNTNNRDREDFDNDDPNHSQQSQNSQNRRNTNKKGDEFDNEDPQRPNQRQGSQYRKSTYKEKHFTEEISKQTHQRQNSQNRRNTNNKGKDGSSETKISQKPNSRQNSQTALNRNTTNKKRQEDLKTEVQRPNQRQNSQSRRNTNNDQQRGQETRERSKSQKTLNESDSENDQGENGERTDRDGQGTEIKYGHLRKPTKYLEKHERESAAHLIREHKKKFSQSDKQGKSTDSHGRDHQEDDEGSGVNSETEGEESQGQNTQKGVGKGKMQPKGNSRKSEIPQAQLKKSSFKQRRSNDSEASIDQHGQKPGTRNPSIRNPKNRSEANDPDDKTRMKSRDPDGKDKRRKTFPDGKKGVNDDHKEKTRADKTLGSIEEMRGESEEDRGRNSTTRKSPSITNRESNERRAEKKKTSFELAQESSDDGERNETEKEKKEKRARGSSMMDMLRESNTRVDELFNPDSESELSMDEVEKEVYRQIYSDDDEEDEGERGMTAQRPPEVAGGSRLVQVSIPSPNQSKHRKEVEETESKFVYGVQIDQEIQLSSFPTQTKGKETANVRSGDESSLEQYLIEAGAVRNKEMQEKENYELHRKLRILRSREEGLVRENENIKSSVKKLDRELDACRLELDMKDERLARLNKEKESQLEEISRLQLKLRNSQLNLGHSGESTRENERELGLLRRQLDNMRKDMEKLLNERDSALRDMRRISSNQNLEKSEKREIAAELDKRKKEVDELKKQVQKYIDEVREAEDLLRQKDEEMEKILEQYRSLTGLEEQRSTLEREATSIRHDVREAFDENISLKNKLASMSSLITKYEEEIAKSSQRIIHLESQIGKIGDDEKMTRVENKSNRDLILTMERKMDKLRQDLGMIESTKNKLLAENTDLRAQLEMHTRQLNMERESRSHLEDEIKTSKEHDMEIQRKHKELSRERTELLTRIDLLDNRCESLSEEVRTYRLKAIEQQSEHDRLVRQLEQEKAERETTRIKNQLHSSSTNLLLSTTMDRSGRSPSPISTHLAPRAQGSSYSVSHHQSRGSHSPSPPSDFNISLPLHSSTSREPGSS